VNGDLSGVKSTIIFTRETRSSVINRNKHTHEKYDTTFLVKYGKRAKLL